VNGIWTTTIAVAVPTTVLVWFATRHAIAVLRARAILDQPNERSSHDTPVPRGGGLAIMAVALPMLALVASLQGASEIWILVAAALMLAALSWLDDVRGLRAGTRLAVHALAVFAGLAVLPGPVLQGAVPPWLDWTLTALGWLWFVNLYNFMDGIDGIAGAETIALAGGVVLVAALPDRPTELVLYAAILGAAAAGFLPWNWHKARVFMGDAGSVPLGYLVGWLILALAALGAWEAAAILPMIYVADATLTLAARALRGERVWQAHREHFYQRAVQRGLTHAQAVRSITAGNLALIGLAVAAEAELGWTALPMAAAVTAIVLWRLSAGRP
jgi:UDP-N-acetylmuramyl pentapeptide phosphotransferase/UDP-N-acetylglucosamine-1-phosphate transferase